MRCLLKLIRMKGTLEISIGMLITIIALIVVAVFILAILAKAGAQQNLSGGCTSIVNYIVSVFKGSNIGSGGTNFPNSIWC